MNNIQIGVIGVGGRGVLADSAHQPENEVYVTAGADPGKQALEAFAKKYPDAELFENYKALLQKPELDAVFICSPDYLHEEHAVAALLAKKAVYLEKPMAITIEGCDRILETSEKTGSKLYLGHNMRHFESVIKMKEIIDAGTIGEIKAVWCRHFISYGGDAYFKDWHSEQKYSNSLLLQKGAHDIDVIHWLTGSYTKSVVGMGKLDVYDKCDRRLESEKSDASFHEENWPPLSQKKLSPIIDVEDHNMILMQLENGVQASYLQCHYTPDSCRNYTFIGTNGRLENRGDHGECSIEVYSSRTDGFTTPDSIYNLKGESEGHGGADPLIVNDFLDYIRGLSEPKTSPLAARNAVAVGVMAAESIRGGSCLKEVKPY
ncbi:MAG: Gfo/Idh/MocA family oxidoreductase [Bacteroidetes bacterium]|nr:Gfo/Idh/MocA family oxidoreductase [Bacteroidota bacterium]